MRIIGNRIAQAIEVQLRRYSAIGDYDGSDGWFPPLHIHDEWDVVLRACHSFDCFVFFSLRVIEFLSCLFSLLAVTLVLCSSISFL